MKLLIIALSFLVSTTAQANRVGNGGGLWSCEDENGVIQKIELVDIWEARVQKKWPLRLFTTSDYAEIVEEIAEDVVVSFPKYATEWNRILDNVMRNKRIVNIDLSRIPDEGEVLGRPHRKNCGGRKWQYRQIANYTKDQGVDADIIIQRDLWEHPKLTPRDQAGLIWHEAIYRWMRIVHGDTVSTRARRIVGLLLSRDPIEKRRRFLEGLLKEDRHGPPPPQNDPPPEDGKWLCVIDMSGDSVFWAYGKSEERAELGVEQKCTEGGGRFCHGTRCERIPHNPRQWVCKIRGGAFNPKIFVGEGRIELEAEMHAKKKCKESRSRSSCMGSRCWIDD